MQSILPTIFRRARGGRQIAAIALGVCLQWLSLGTCDWHPEAGRVWSAQLEIVVPAYFYPSGGSDWNQLNAVAGQVPITAIMNPFNGPGNSIDSNYVAAVNSFRAAGGRVIGYVHTTYTERPLQQVLADIDRYEDWYEVDGIFVDEMANTGPAERLNYYRDIYNHVKAIDPAWEVMGNPGTQTIEEYLTWPTADRLMVFEGFGSNYLEHTPASWNFDYESTRFVHLVHTESSSTEMLHHLQRAVERNAGGIYVTDDLMPNPWDRLPAYWSELVHAVALANADFNRDGVINAADYPVWRSSIGQTGPGLDADASGDGVVDGDDYELWRRHFGMVVATTVGGLSAASAAPEPGSILFVVIAVGAIVPVHRGTRTSS